MPKLFVLLVLNYSLGALANPLTHPPSSLTLPPCPPDMLLPPSAALAAGIFVVALLLVDFLRPEWLNMDP